MPDFSHPSGQTGAYLRASQKPTHRGVVFRDGRYVTSADLNDAFEIQRQRGVRTSDLVALNGDRVDGAEIIVDIPAETITTTDGEIYLLGDVHVVPGEVLTNVPMTGSLLVGVRIWSEWIDEVDDPDLLGLHPGSESEGEKATGRETIHVCWGHDQDGMDEHELTPVYTLQDGVPVDQSPPPALTGVNQAIRRYDIDANGSYIASGHRVTALGLIGGAQHFSIQKGTANVDGNKLDRYSDLRHFEAEAPDLDTIDAETHTYNNGGSDPAVITLAHAPVEAILNVIVTKETTQSLTKGVTDSIENLPHGSVTEIVSVVKGATTYTQTTDYVLNADRVDWTPGGAEPAQGESYDVTYRYLDSVPHDSFDETTVTISGGVNGEQCIINYRYKMPRIDVLCLNAAGNSVYINGLSNRDRGVLVPPQIPTYLLKLCEIEMSWFSAQTPSINNNGVRAYHYTRIDQMYRRIIDMLDLLGLERLRRDIDEREPVAKKGVFVDPFTSDRYRDSGELDQTAAIFEGSLQLAVDPTLYITDMAGPIMLDYTNEIIIEQLLTTSCWKVNPYVNFEPLRSAMTITPSQDFWTETRTDWLSDVTQTFGTGNRTRTTEEVNMVDDSEELLEFLRTIDIDFTIDGFAVGEVLTSLTFDGLDVTPDPALAADVDGIINGTFTIPENVTAGEKQVVAEGAGESFAEARFVGQGILEIDVWQRLITVERWAPPPAFQQGWNMGEAGDPLAQTWAPATGRHIVGVDLKFCAIGDADNGCVVELVEVRDGTPTTQVVVQKFVNMNQVVVDQWFTVEFDLPPFRSPVREYAFVVKTDDPDHSLAVAAVGDFDPVTQQRVGAQPYTVGVLHSSSNARSWTAHQNEDLAMRIRAAVFDPTTKTVVLDTFAVVDASDLLVRGTAFLPTGNCSFYFEMELDDGTIYKVNSNENVELNYYYTGNVILRAVLTGTIHESPMLMPGVMLIAGKIRQTGTYISRAFDMGVSIQVHSWLKAKLPAGPSTTSTVAFDVDAADDNWQNVPETLSSALNDGWLAKEHTDLDHTAVPEGRLRITITGGPDARPSIADLRSATF